jgi:two-component system nitrogen regulation response regulator GlnG
MTGSTSKNSLLVVDDEENIVYTIKEALSSKTLLVESASTATEGLKHVESKRPDAVLLDVRLPDMSGLDAFIRIQEMDPTIPVIIMTAYTNTETAIDAMRRGAFEYFVKPVDFLALQSAVERAVSAHKFRTISAVPASGDEDDNEVPTPDLIIGNSPAMQEVYKTIGRVASQDVTVLILGESGTGKELVARALYQYSRRSQLPFLAVNCAALSESLLESELFGHEKGAFTGADQRRIGKFEQVNGGTIFLDEIGDMSLSTQAKALRLLQQQQFERLGGNSTVQTDVRIIAATNHDLGKMVSEGRFREDLFYRLNGFTLHLPPLRQRREDIPMLVNYFRRILNDKLGRRIQSFSESAMRLLNGYSWPGNVRQLFSAVRFAMVQTRSETVFPDCLPSFCRMPSVHSSLSPQPVVTANDSHSTDTGSISTANQSLQEVGDLTKQLFAQGSNNIYREVIDAVDRAVLQEVIAATKNNQVEASERLGISRMTLRAKLRSINEKKSS